MKRPFTVLFVASLCGWSPGNGLFPLLPAYALDLGASTGSSGVVLAAGFAALATGSLLADRLARAVGSRKWTYIAAALVQAPAYALMGVAATAWQLLILLSIAWLCGGITTTLINIIAGVGVAATRRGRIFGLLSMTIPLGSLLGAAGAGALVATHGYQATFAAAGLLALAAPLLVAAGLPGDQYRSTTAPGHPIAAERAPSVTLAALLLAALLSSVALFLGHLGTSITMRALAFSLEAITSTTAIGGLVTLLLAPLVSGLSDRLGRRRLLTGTYLLIAAGMGVLSTAQQLWHFSLAVTLLSLGAATSGSVAAALAADILPPSGLARGLSRLGATTWLAAIIGFAVGGVMLERVDASALYLGAALLAACAGIPLGWRGQQPSKLAAVPVKAGGHD